MGLRNRRVRRGILGAGFYQLLSLRDGALSRALDVIEDTQISYLRSGELGPGYHKVAISLCD
jgi:hypothetical protein